MEEFIVSLVDGTADSYTFRHNLRDTLSSWKGS